jgi:outer membrane lipoprotein SlyB
MAANRAKGVNVPMVQKNKPWKIAWSAGSGMAIGAALGLLFGLMLADGAILFPVAGAVFGAVIGTVWEL